MTKHRCCFYVAFSKALRISFNSYTFLTRLLIMKNRIECAINDVALM